ncbi:MAG: periplasmic heavy metal sensor [Myxococcales bacterium]|nr:periplasmic heavy metal sensor [Myxococcales bacterium]
MAPTDSTSPRTVRLLTAVLLAATFAAGTATGIGLCRWMAPSHAPHPPGMPPPGPLPVEELGLSAAQREEVRAILERHRPELEAVLEESFPKVRAINEQIEREVRALLTPDQAARLDRIQANRPPPGPPPFGPRGGPPGPPPFGPPGGPPPP